MRRTHLPLAATLALLLAAAVSLAAPFADKAGDGGGDGGGPQLNPAQVAALARQLTNELAEAVAEAAGDTSQRAPAMEEAMETAKGAEGLDGSSGSTLAIGKEMSKAPIAQVSSRNKGGVAGKSLVGEAPRVDDEAFAGDPVRLTINLLIGDQTQATETGLVGDESQASYSVVVGDTTRIKDKAMSIGRALASDTATVTNTPTMNDDRTVRLLKLSKNEDPSKEKSVTSVNRANGDIALVKDKAMEAINDLGYHKNQMSGNGLSRDKASINKALEKELMKDTQSAQILMCNNVPVSLKFGPTGEVVVNGKALANTKELSSDNKLINKKEQESDQALMPPVRGKMGNEVIVTVQAFVRNKDLTSVKTPTVSNAHNDDGRKLLKEKPGSNDRGLVSDKNLQDKATKSIKNFLDDDMALEQNPTTRGHKDTALLVFSGSGLTSKSFASSSFTTTILMTEDRSSISTSTPKTSTVQQSTTKQTLSPTLGDVLTSTPTAIWIFTARPIASGLTGKSTAESTATSSTLISTIPSKSASTEQDYSTFSTRNNELPITEDRSTRGDAMLVSEIYEDSTMNAEVEKGDEGTGRRVRRQNEDYDPEEIGRQLAAVLGRAANARRDTEQERSDITGTESPDISAEEKSPAGNRRSRQGQEAMEGEVAPAAGSMAPAKDSILPAEDAVENSERDSENVVVPEEDLLVRESGASNGNVADRDENAKVMAAGAPLSSWASQDAGNWLATSSPAEVTYHASTSQGPPPLRSLEGMPTANEEQLVFNNAFEVKRKKDGQHSKKSSKENVPWLIDADGDHIMLVPNEPSTSAKPPSEQRHPPGTESKTPDAVAATSAWRHVSGSSAGTDSKSALLSNLKKLEQELNRQRADALGKGTEEPKSPTLKAPIAVFDVKDSKGVVLMVEGNGPTKGPIVTDEIKKLSGSSKLDINAKQPTFIQNTKELENCADIAEKIVQAQINNKKTEQENCKPLDEKSKSQCTRTKPRTEIQKTKTPPCVMLGKLMGKNNTTFVQRTLIETAVVPGPDGCLTANTAILVHQTFEQPSKASECKTSPPPTVCNPCSSSAGLAASNASRPNASKSAPVCVASGRMPEMLPVGDGRDRRKDGEAAIDLGGPGTLSGRPQVSNAGASGVLPSKSRSSKSDAAAGDDEDIVRGRPMSVAGRASGGSGGGSEADDDENVAHRRPEDPKSVAEADAIDLGVPGGLGGRPQISSAGATGTLRVFKKIREKQKEDVADNEDASTAANVLFGVSDASEQTRPVSGVVRSKGERSHARVQMAVPETGVLYGGDSGPEVVVVTDSAAAMPRAEDAGAAGDPAGGGGVGADTGGDWAMASASAKLPEEAAVRERAGLGENPLGRQSSEADDAKEAQLAEALGIRDPPTEAGQAGSLLSTSGRWSEGESEGEGAGTRRRHKRPRPPPSLLILPDDRLEMDVGVTLQRPQDDAEDTPR